MVPYANSISCSELINLVGTPDCPAIMDVRRRTVFDEANTLIASAVWRDHMQALQWVKDLPAGRPIVLYCMHGHQVSQAPAAILRAAGYDARYLAGGIADYESAGGLLLHKSGLSRHDWSTPTRWVTRERPKIDRIACPWLIRRFVDPFARIHFVSPDMVRDTAQEIDAIAFDIPDVEFTHDGNRCSFDMFIKRFGLAHPALDTLADVVRGADTGDFSTVAQAAGLAALSFGLSALYARDEDAVSAGAGLYDALYAWTRHARDETHSWQPKPAA